MDILLIDLEELMQSEAEHWAEIFLPLKWTVYKNANSLYVRIYIDIAYNDDHQRPCIFEGEIRNVEDLHTKIGDFLKSTRNP